jgi:hypothetical protein
MTLRHEEQEKFGSVPSSVSRASFKPAPCRYFFVANELMPLQHDLKIFMDGGIKKNSAARMKY